VVDSDRKLCGLLSIDDVAANMSSNRLLSNLVREISAA
jgi:hypothetical protein